MLARLFLITVLSGFILGASIIPCPETCICNIIKEEIHAKCSSFDFLPRLQPKQASKLVALYITGRSIASIDPKIKYLRNLRILDMSKNKIRNPPVFPNMAKLEVLDLSLNQLDEIKVETLPKNLKKLNLSSNKISAIPTDWSWLHNLKALDFTGNPIFCSCHTTTLRDNLLKSKINVVEPVFCNEPSEFHGESWSAESICRTNFWEIALGDEPMEGSGSGDLDWISLNNAESIDTDSSSIEPEYIPENRVTEKSEPFVVETTEQPDEGSGDGGLYAKPTLIPDDADEDEDYYEEETTTLLPPIDETQIEKDEDFKGKDRPKPCYTNCSTPAPLGENDEAFASEPPDLLKGFRIIYDDLSGKESEPEPTENPATVDDELSTEPPKEGRRLDTSDVEVVKSESPKELEKIVEEPPRSARLTYIVLSILLIVMILVIVYAIVKSKNRRAKNRRRRLQSKDLNKGTEMKLLTTPPNIPEKINNVPERVPLMNGQNGTQNGKAVDDTDTKENSVELRQKNGENRLSPEAKRVTIRASEIPDSVPKTPVLVNRHVSSDGNIITTPSVDQRV